MLQPDPAAPPPQTPLRRSLRRRDVAFFLANLAFIFQGLVGYLGVVAGLLPQDPTDDISFFLVAVAYHGAFFAFWDSPGEQRTAEQRCRLYIRWWLITALSAVLFWELPWYYLEAHILRLDRPTDVFHEDLRHLWIFWGYGIADSRFLTGDPTVKAVEWLSVHTGLAMLPAFFAMQRDRIWAFWLGALGMSGVAYATVIYVISEWYVGWPHVSLRPYDFWVKFLLTQTPYIFYGGFAAVCCLYVAQQIALRRHSRMPTFSPGSATK